MWKCYQVGSFLRKYKLPKVTEKVAKKSRAVTIDKI